MGEQVAARILWGCSSVGRAPALQAGGHEFESHHLHFKLNMKRASKRGHSPVWRAKATLCHSVASPLIQLLPDLNVKASFPSVPSKSVH